MKALFVASVLLFSLNSLAAVYSCSAKGESQVLLTFTTEKNQIKSHSALFHSDVSEVAASVQHDFLIEDYNDTRTWISVSLKEDKVVEVYESIQGNDSDNYLAAKTSTEIACKAL